MAGYKVSFEKSQAAGRLQSGAGRAFKRGLKMMGSISSRLAWVVCAASALSLHAQVAKGPDAFGYTATNGAAASFRDISQTGIRILQNSEDGSAGITPGFALRVYGHTAAQICVAVNGVIATGACAENADKSPKEYLGPSDDPASFTPDPDATLVAPFWGDLSFDDPNADAIYYETIGNDPDQQFIVQWNKALDAVSGQVVTFQVVFSQRTGAITFQYLDFGSPDPNALFGASNFIGIRDVSGNTNGKQLKWSFNADVIAKGSSIQFSAPDSISCQLTLGADTVPVVAGGGDKSVGVTVNTGCPWTASTTESWIAISSGAAGSGAGAVSLSVVANSGTTSREGSVVIGGKTVKVQQAGVTVTPPPVIPPTTSKPSLAAASDSIVIEAVQGMSVTGKVAITATAPVSFTAAVLPTAEFLSVPAGSTWTPGNLQIQASAAGLAPGEYKGTIRVTSPSTDNWQTVNVTLRVLPLVLSVSDATLTVELSQDADAVERTVSLTSNGLPLTFAAATAPDAKFLTVSPASGSAPGTVKIGVSPAGLAPGSYTGTVTITPAGATAQTVTVNLKVSAGAKRPVFEAKGFVNGASFAGGPVAPGGIVSIFGTNLADAEDQAKSVPLPVSLGGVTATVNGVAAPLFYVSPTQVNLQVPVETAPGKATVVLSLNGMASAPVEIVVARVGPGTFMLGTNRRAAALNQDYSVNAPDKPTKPGAVLMLYVTGLGELDKPLGTGMPAPLDSLYRLRSTVEATVGGKPATVVFAGLAPGFVGLYQVNVIVPDLPAGDHEVVLTVEGAATNPALVTVAP